MKSYKVSLKKEYGIEWGELECILSDCPYDVDKPEWKRPAVIVVPGGAYWMVSKREGEPVADCFLAKGYQTFILTYSTRSTCPESRYPDQLTQLAAAVDYVKKHAEECFVNPEEVFVVGFSAGGHLVADLAVEYPCIKEKTNLDLDCRPAAVGLAYPVISHKYGHVDSYYNLLQGYTEEAQAKLMEELDLDERVTDSTPPAFLWSTSEDACVPSTNSLMYAAALAKHKIPYELHVYPKGWHGLSTCNGEVNAPQDFFAKNSTWVENCASFFRLFTKETF